MRQSPRLKPEPRFSLFTQKCPNTYYSKTKLHFALRLIFVRSHKYREHMHYRKITILLLLYVQLIKQIKSHR